MLDKTALGNRYICFKCGTKFYDLNRPAPLCPECESDQREAPIRDIRSLLSGGPSMRKIAKEEEEEEAMPLDDDDDLELDLDDDDDDDLDDDDDEGLGFDDIG